MLLHGLEQKNLCHCCIRAIKSRIIDKILTHSLVLLNEISLSLLFLLLLFDLGFFSALRNFNSGIVEPPNINVVNRTMIRVVVMITCLVSSLKSKCNDNA